MVLYVEGCVKHGEVNYNQQKSTIENLIVMNQVQ